MNSDGFVIKCGGSTLAALPDAFYRDLRTLQEKGPMPVLVHGGGPAISEALQKFGIQTEFVNGLRKTTEEVLDIVEMVLSGKINKEIVRRIRQNGGRAVGLSGVDGPLLHAEKLKSKEDIGYVGEVREVNTGLVARIVEAGYVPVIAPIGLDHAGQRYNINADTAAGAVAASLGVSRMVVVTDVPGIMRPSGGRMEVLPAVSTRDIDSMIGDGTIRGGMIPKVKAAMQCLQGSVTEVAIVNGAEPEVLSRLLAGEEIGTRITA